MMMIAGISPAFAEWQLITPESERGSWEICERTHWKENLESTIGFAEWDNNTETITNFTGYYATVRFTELNVGATGWGWWENYAVLQFSLWLNFTGVGGDKIVLNLDFKRRIDLWGAIGGMGVLSCVRENLPYWGTEAGTLNYEYDPLFSFAGYTEVFFYRDGGNLTVAVYNYYSLLENPTKLTVASFAVGEAWFTDVSFNVAVRHQGFHPHNFEGFLENEDFNYTLGELPTPKELGESVIDLFVRGLINTVEAIPQWLRSMLDMVYGWLKYLTDLSAGMLFTIVSAVIPFLPYILVFYVVDAGVTSITSGSFQPIGIAFLNLYGFAVSIISGIIGAIQTIYDFIHFW